MPDLLTTLLSAACGYVLGSISFALVLARMHGIDLRDHGSGNPGATNAGRALGPVTGLLIYLLDAGKGMLPAWLAWRWGDSIAAGAIAGGAAFVGHIWPVFHRFRGGKGVATLSGVMLVLEPFAVLWSALPMVLVVLLSRIMASGSIAFGLALPLAAWWLQAADSVVVLALAGGLFLNFTHRSNIQRMLAGTERRIGSRKEEA